MRTQYFGHIAIILPVLLFAAALRIYRLEAEPFWADELSSVRHLSAPTVSEFIERVRLEGAPIMPLYFVLEYFFAKYVGSEPTLIRLPSLIMGCATVLITYLMAAARVSRPAAALAALTIALLPAQIEYSQEVRNYPLTILLAAAALLSLDRAAALRSPAWLLVNAAAACMLPWSHLFTLPLVASIALFLALRSDLPAAWKILWYIAAGANMGILSLWILAGDLHAAFGGTYWLKPLDFQSLLLPLVWVHTLLPVPPAIQFATGVDIFIAGAISAILLCKVSPRLRPVILLCLICIVLPVLALAVPSIVLRPALTPKYLLHTAIPISILLAIAADRAFHSPRAWTAAIAALMITGLANFASLPRPFRTDWYSAKTLLEGIDLPACGMITLLHMEKREASHHLQVPLKQIFVAWRPPLAQSKLRESLDQHGCAVLFATFASERQGSEWMDDTFRALKGAGFSCALTYTSGRYPIGVLFVHGN